MPGASLQWPEILLKETAAVGAVKEAVLLGRKFLEAWRCGRSTVETVAEHLKGEVVAKGRVRRLELATRGGFDVGYVKLDSGYELAFWNEYMLLESGGKRCYTFPDLIVTFDETNGQVVNTSDIKEDMQLAVMDTKRANLILGAGMRDHNLVDRIEEAIDRPMKQYLFGVN